jgi:ferredoxin
MIRFMPVGAEIEVNPNTKILSGALKGKVPIQYGCASCRCGTCGIRIVGEANLSSMAADEKALIQKMGLSTSGEIRLACRARIMDGSVEIDLEFQKTYSPSDGDGDLG